MSNAGTSTHSLGQAVERLEAKWASITAFGVLLVVLGFAALAFSLVATIATVTLNGVLFLIARRGGNRHRHAFPNLGLVLPVGDRRRSLSGRRRDLHRQSGARFGRADASCSAPA